ncbi:MAG: hypothetical protein H0V70_16290 [Ktedonobacteraceae bacterium]|nr:hypothetical protein [Ktedonobacteraceae bacterium]
MSYDVGVHTTRVAKARIACAYFKDIVAELESAEKHIRALQIWRDNYAASRHGLESAESRLRDLV